MTTTVWLVPQTHWDREWCEPFQRFRLRLVDLMDDVVAPAKREPDCRCTTDGQMAVAVDCLEVRLEQTDRVSPRRAWPARDRPVARPHGRAFMLRPDEDLKLRGRRATVAHR